MVRRVGDRQVITACCPYSDAAGVQPGISLAEARSLLSADLNPADRANHRNDSSPPSSIRTLQIADHDPDGDATALHRLAVWSTRWLPAVQPDEPSPEQQGASPGLLADITGCARAAGGESTIQHHLLTALHQRGIHARAAIAPTPGAAWSLAHFGVDDAHEQYPSHEPHDLCLGSPDSPTSPDTIATALADLPVAALRLDADAVENLAELGIVRIGQLLQVPRCELPARFGDDLILRIDQALGHVPEPIRPVKTARPVVVERVFDGPLTDQNALMIVTRQLLDSLTEQLTQREAAASHFRLRADRFDAPPTTLDVRVSHPSRDTHHLWRLFQPRLERLDLTHGLQALRLAAGQRTRRVHTQNAFTADFPGNFPTHFADFAEHHPQPTPEQSHEHRAAIGTLIDTLTARLGSHRMLRAALTEAHLPEAAVRLHPAATTPSDLQHRRRSTGTHPDTPQVTRHARPSQLLDHPIPIEVTFLVPDGPIAQVTLPHRYRPTPAVTHHHHLQTSSPAVTSCLGPERIVGPWWRLGRNTPRRDYYRVCIEGQWFWIFRDAKRQWFLHGLWV